MKKLSVDKMILTIRTKRKEMNLTQADLAKKTGINRVTIGRIENKEYTPSIEQLQRFGEALGFEPTDLFIEDIESKKPTLAKKYNIEIQERELSDEEKRIRSDRESMFIVNAWAQQYFSQILHEHVEGKTVGMRYFIERGFREETIRKFQLGYSLDQRDALYQQAIRKGYKKEYLEKTGLVIAYENGNVNDRFRGRVIFPVHSLSGKVVAFGGRVLKKDEKTAKYVNSPESPIYHKSNELYGIYFAKQAIVKADRCYLVEGYTDVISMHQSGVENVVASSGTALTHGQIRLIHRFTNNITVLYDGDAAGIKAAIRGIDLLLDEGMRTLSERLLFHYDPELEATARIHPDKPEYGRREKVCLELEFRDAEGDPLTGNVSLSVTDSRIIDQFLA